MKGSTKAAITVLGIGLAAYLIFVYKSATAPPQEGGSLLQQAQDAVLGGLIGAPSRNGSTGQSGLTGEAQFAANQAVASILGQPSINGSVGTPNILTRTLNDLQLGWNNLFPTGNTGSNAPQKTNPVPSATTLSLFTANPASNQQQVAAALGLNASQINPAVNSITAGTTSYSYGSTTQSFATPQYVAPQFTAAAQKSSFSSPLAYANQIAVGTPNTYSASQITTADQSRNLIGQGYIFNVGAQTWVKK